MGFLWALVLVPVGFFVVSRVRRRARFMRRYWMHYAGHHSFHHRGYGGLRGFERPSPRRMLSGLFRELDASPGQEKAIVKLVEQLSDKLRDARLDFTTARRDLSHVLEGEVFDAAALDAAFERSTELLNRLGAELKVALAELHALLDEDQRKLVAALIARGFGDGRPRRPYVHEAYAL